MIYTNSGGERENLNRESKNVFRGTFWGERMMMVLMVITDQLAEHLLGRFCSQAIHIIYC